MVVKYFIEMIVRAYGVSKISRIMKYVTYFRKIRCFMSFDRCLEAVWIVNDDLEEQEILLTYPQTQM